jgi:nitrate/TMAO reductase-like tetraheme cytochrome c subunit
LDQSRKNIGSLNVVNNRRQDYGCLWGRRGRAETAVSIRRWLPTLGILIVGGLLGAAAVVGSTEVNRLTATDAFCTSCHTMATLAADPHFKQSAHRNNAVAVRPSCGDCHIPRTNWWIETYTHAVKGIKDIISENTHDFSDPKAWEAYQVELAHFVRNEMRSQDSVTCRSCHDAQSIHPASERGQAAHALLREGRMTCIDCHFNLVHALVPPRIEFIRGSGIGGGKK